MTAQPALDKLADRLRQVEYALADAQARVPGLRSEVGEIRAAIAAHACAAAERPGYGAAE